MVSAYGRLKMKCLYMAGTMTKSVRLGNGKIVVFVRGWNHDKVSA